MRTILGLGVAARHAAATSSSNTPDRQFVNRIIDNMRWRLPLSWTFHSRTVAQTSKSVSQVSKPAGAPVVPTCCRFGNRRYSRFGNLRYACFARLPQHHFELSNFGLDDLFRSSGFCVRGIEPLNRSSRRKEAPTSFR